MFVKTDIFCQKKFVFDKIDIFIVNIFVFDKIDIFINHCCFFSQPFLIKTFELSSVFCLAFTFWPCIVQFVFQSLNNILIENININIDIHLPKSSVFCLTALFRVGSGVINVINYDTGYFRYCTDPTNDDNDGRDDHHLTMILTISGGDYYGMKSCKYRYKN